MVRWWQEGHQEGAEGKHRRRTIETELLTTDANDAYSYYNVTDEAPLKAPNQEDVSKYRFPCFDTLKPEPEEKVESIGEKRPDESVEANVPGSQAVIEKEVIEEEFLQYKTNVPGSQVDQAGEVLTEELGRYLKKPGRSSDVQDRENPGDAVQRRQMGENNKGQDSNK